MFGLKFGLHVDALLEQNALKQRVFVPQHEALISCGAMSSIEIGQGLLLDTDCLLQLLDVLCPPFSESSLRLSVPLLPLLCSSVDLQRVSDLRDDSRTDHSASNSGPQLRRASAAS